MRNSERAMVGTIGNTEWGLRNMTLSLVLVLSLSVTLKADDGPTFEQANKILTKYCAGCHNAEEANGDFALDSYDAIVKGGENGNVMTPGSANSSRMIQMINGKLEPKMPPESEASPTDEEIETLVDWIESGASGPNGKSPSTKLDSPKIKSKTKTNPITSLAFSGDEKSYAIGRFGSIEIRDSDSDNTTVSIKGLPGKVTSLQFVDDDQFVIAGTGVTGLYGEAILLELETQKIVRRYRGHQDIVYGVAVSKDNKWIATSGYDRKAVLFKFGNDQPVREFIGHNDAVFETAFDSSAELLLTTSADATTKVWDAKTSERLDTRGEPLKEQYTLAVSSVDHSFFSAGEDNRIRKWRLVSRKPNQTNPLLISRFAHESAIEVLRFHPDQNHLVSVAEDGRIKIWDAKSLSQRHVFDLQTESVQAIAVGTSQIIVGRMDGTIDQLEWPADRLKDLPDVSTSATKTAKTKIRNNKKPKEVSESEPNNSTDKANVFIAPFIATGVINAKDGNDVDTFQFAAKRGERWVIETKAARDKSPLDSHIAILNSEGQPVPRVLLRATRDSYFTFRGKDSKQTGDFRIHNWEEMRLNQLLYCNGEVVRLYHYPRGPDSGFNVYPNFGNRHGMFDTTPITHALHEPCYIVEAHPPGTKLPQNGLPSFLLNYENDDDSTRRNGKDSRLTFKAPEDGDYLVRVRDSRDFGGEKYKYTLSVLPAKPSFRIKQLAGEKPTLVRDGYKKISVTIDRDNFDGPVSIEINDLPAGISAPGPIVIEPNNLMAFFTLHVSDDAPVPSDDEMSSTLTATAMIEGKQVRKTKPFGKIKIASDPKLKIRFKHADKMMPHFDRNRRPVLEIRPGETITAKIEVTRLGHKERINFGKESAALNLPFGVYVDNTGLNGVLIPPGKNERTIFLTAEEWVEPCERLIFLQADEAGKPSSNPAVLRVIAK